MFSKGVKIIASGTGIPDTIHKNSTIEKNAPTSAKWIKERLGIHERRIAVNQSISDLGVMAFKDAIKSCEIPIKENDIDMIIVATSSPEKISPSTACTIHKKLNLKRDIPCFDINAVCSGFVFALHIAAPLISSGAYKNIMIIGTETYSKITDWSDRNCVFFGDGAGAIILGQSKKGWLYSEIKSNGSNTGSTGFSCELGENYKTVPRQVWEAGIEFLPKSIKSVLDKTNIQPEDISKFFPHQASIHMLKEIANKSNLNSDKIKKVMNKYGNIAGASIPIALNDAFKNNEIKSGDKLLLSAIGSGWSWGSVVISHE